MSQLAPGFLNFGAIGSQPVPVTISATDSVQITGGVITLSNAVASPANGQYYGYSNNARGWFQPGFSNILDYGADPTGTNDNSTALSAALSSLPSAGGTVYFPHGVYKFTNPVSYSVASPCSVTLLGDGMDASKLTWTTAQ